jgi:hypothetical protein
MFSYCFGQQGDQLHFGYAKSFPMYDKSRQKSLEWLMVLTMVYPAVPSHPECRFQGGLVIGFDSQILLELNVVFASNSVHFLRLQTLRWFNTLIA